MGKWSKNDSQTGRTAEKNENELEFIEKQPIL